MEENRLEINEKLYGFSGVIGRHAYFLNIIIICAINTVLLFPYTIYVSTHTGNFQDLFNMSSQFWNSPILLRTWIVIATAGLCLLSTSNIIRRLNDIFGEERKATSVISGLIFIIYSFSFVMPLGYTILFAILTFTISMFLFFIKGKITGALPYDYKKEFNWGAFFGTWIWGLFNKSYIPLFELLLWITPLGLYFQLYCGLKGNEWAYKNKNCTDVEAFNKSQENQSLIFTILSLVIIPILYIAIIFAIVFVLIFSTIGATKNMTPEQRKQQSERIESNMNKFLDWMVSVYFERYEIDETENKFYVTDKDWSGADFKEKKDMLELGATKAAEFRGNEYKKRNPKGYHHFSKTSELPRTKIYSSTSGKLLGEFVMDDKAMNGSFKEAFKAALKAYRFYNP